MKYIFIIFFSILLSCSKEECQTCKSVVRSNLIEAQEKCNGSDNNFPNGFITVKTIELGTLCPDDIESAKVLIAKENKVINVCQGVSATVKGEVVCF